MEIKAAACIGLLFMGMVLSGCSPAIIQSQLRETDENARMITRCVEVDMRNNAEMEAALKKFDGWRVIYISEYTTGHKVGTDAAVCFEKPMP